VLKSEVFENPLPYGRGSVVALAQKPENLITTSDIKAQMYFLASDDMAGRDAGSLGGRIAANYIASEFARLGLKPRRRWGVLLSESRARPV
jgi:hypothetical protein